LEQAGIHVIPVALGSEANARELLLITPYNDNLVTVKPTDKPENSAKEIMDKALAGTNIYKYEKSIIKYEKNYQKKFQK